MRVINLASGSDGNLTYIETDSSKILLDMGLSCNETVKRLDLLNVKPQDIDGIFITHQHIDHIKGVDIFSSKYDVPVYSHREVWNGLDEKLVKASLKNRKAFDGDFTFQDLDVMPIEVSHDVKCFAYAFKNGDSKVSIVTDLGHTNQILLNKIASSQIVYLEANYDKDMLLNGTKYPLTLKRRIAGPNGHLSNEDSAKTIRFLAESGTRQIVLSHLSKENNSPSLAYEYISEKLLEDGIREGSDIKIDVASPRPGAIFRLK